MVGENKDLMLLTFQIMTLSLEGFNNSRELAVKNFVPNLRRDYLSGEKSYWMTLASFRIWIFVSHITGKILI